MLVFGKDGLNKLIFSFFNSKVKICANRIKDKGKKLIYFMKNI